MQEGYELDRFVSRYAVALSGADSPTWMTVDGTLCHIDISGFTSLSERLATLGRVGAEELTEVLDTVFGSMLALVRERNGALLKFGGDALLLLFDGDDHAVQAASAAVEMRAALRSSSEVPTSVGKLALKMSIGLHSGDIHLFGASGSHVELIIAGLAVSTVIEMEETALAGEIVVSSATRDLLPITSALQPRGNGWLLPWRTTRSEPAGPSDDATCRDVSDHIPAALRSHLTTHKADAEHRLATVAFVEFIGVNGLLEVGGMEDASRVFDSLIAAITAIADEEGVTFLGTDVDRDAGKIILVSGVPITVVDESGRLLRAARRIVDLDSPLRLKIGIHRGHVFSGEIGSGVRSTYTIMGDTVNLAARLMAAAPPGSILATRGPLDDSRTLFGSTALDPMSVKGKTEPVKAYAVGVEKGSRSVHGTRGLPFSGREAESKIILDALDGLESGGASITIHGPTGIGKSRLIEESLSETEIHRIEVRAEPYGAANPFRPFRDPLRSLVGIQNVPADEMTSTLLDTIRDQAPELIPLAPLIGDLAHVDVPETEVTRAIDSRFRQNRAVDAAVEFLVAVTSGPLVIVAEDMHWADAGTLLLLERLERESEQRQWLVLITSRIAPDEPHATDIGLVPLDSDVVETLVHTGTEASPLRTEEVAAVVKRSGGNPLFVEELLKVVTETGSIESLPTSLDGVVGSQIDALEPLARQVLRYVSVLGRSFRTSIARDLMKTQGIELNAATRETLMTFLDDDGPKRLQFRHALVRDVAYEGLSYRRRRDLHDKAGHLVLEAAGSNDKVVADILAVHFSAGSEHRLAWRYCRMAGNHNMDVYANAEAATQFERALEAAKRLGGVAEDERRDVWIKLGDVRERSGSFESALDAYRRASKLTSSDDVGTAGILLKRARAKERAGAYVAALGETTRAANLLVGASEPSALGLLAHVKGYAALIRQAQEKPRLALDAARESAEIAARADDELALARAWKVMDYAYVMLGEPESAVYSVKALEIYRERGELADEAGVSTNLGVYAYWNGEWERALEYYEQGRVASTRAGSMVDAATAAENIGEVLVNQGRYEDAENPLREARRIFRASGFSEGVAFTDLLLGRMYGIRGSLSDSEKSLKEAIVANEALGLGGAGLEAAIYLADAQCRSGSPETGLATLIAAESKAPADYVDYFQPLLSRFRGSILSAAGRGDEAAAALESGIALADERGDMYEFGLLVLTLENISGDKLDATLRHRAHEALRLLGVRSAPGISIPT